MLALNSWEPGGSPWGQGRQVQGRAGPALVRGEGDGPW